MSGSTMSVVSQNQNAGELPALKDYLTVYIGQQQFGLPVLSVQDVLGPQNMARVPMARPEIAGLLNLRGRIVTAIDMHSRLNISINSLSLSATQQKMSIVVEYDSELFSLVFDRVGDVKSLSRDSFELCPPTLDQSLREVADGIYREMDDLIVVLNIPKLFADLVIPAGEVH